MFFKKGDPTLSKNYRPISSMNTDCKLYTNLVNNRLSPWAQCKLHDDQKGFVPGRRITDHTRLAYEAAHLATVTGTRGFLVSLDQAKAYDRVDQSWLLRVMSHMGVSTDLRALISDIIHGCKSRVRINGGYSTAFSLRRGVRQGDPLSCLLFNFSIEPLAMRLRSTLSGFSVHGLPPIKVSVHGLPPIKVLFYADDVNMFLSPSDSLPAVVSCLDDTSFAIGSKFNHDKTDVKPLGPPGFVQSCFDSQSLGGQSLPGSYVLAPSAPLRVLGVWVASQDRASARWDQIYEHICKLIRQWLSIGASLPNRVLIAKALLLSRCYYLLDGNSTPLPVLRRISRAVLRFVRGPFSNAPYALLQSSLADGGLNCPSLETRRVAYDLKFLSDLISGPHTVLWRAWTYYDLTLSSFSSDAMDPVHINLLLQRGHTRLAFLSDRLRSAFQSARLVGVDLRSVFPSLSAREFLPLFHHPALGTRSVCLTRCIGLRSHGVLSFDDVMALLTSPPSLGCAACDSEVSSLSDLIFADPLDPAVLSAFSRPRCPLDRLPSDCPGLSHHRITSFDALMSHLVSGRRFLNCGSCDRSISRLSDRIYNNPVDPFIRKALSRASLCPGLPSHGVSMAFHVSHPPPAALACSSCRRTLSVIASAFVGTSWDPALPPPPPSRLSIWPTAASANDCLRVFTSPQSIVASQDNVRRGGPRSRGAPYAPHTAALPLGFPRRVSPVDIWTDGSALDNGLEHCTASAAWVSSSHISDAASLSGVPLSNNLAEVAAVLLALLSWPTGPLHVHTDSTFVLSLVHGGLTSLERNGWPSFPWLCRTTGPAPIRLAGVFQHLLFLLRSHDGPLSFSKAASHSSDVFNNIADSLANEAQVSGRVFSLAELDTPPGWVDTHPVLHDQPLSFLTSYSVRALLEPPILSYRLSPTSDKWSILFWRSFGTKVDIASHLPRLWKICVPPGLRELLWKSIFGALPLGASWRSVRDIGLAYCPCSHAEPLDLFHIFMGCAYFPIADLYRTVLCPALMSVSGRGGAHVSADPERWYRLWWFPLLCFKRLSHCGTTATQRSALCRSVRQREWIYGSFLWEIWCTRMKMAHDPSYFFSTVLTACSLKDRFALLPPSDA